MKKTFLFSILVFIIFLIPSSLSAIEFSDTKDHWAEKYIQNVADYGLIKGYLDGSFRPDQNISRAEFVTILAQESGETITKESVHAEEFPDVPQNHWARHFILWGRENEILKGYDDGTFRPDNIVTRQEMASLLYRYIINYHKKDIIENSQAVTFVDDHFIGDWAKPGVYAMQRSGIIHGRGNYIFDPLAGTSRAEATVMMSNYLKYYRLPLTDITKADIYFNNELKATNLTTIRQNDTIMAPARAILEASGYEVTYYPRSMLIVASRIDSDLEFWIGKTTYYKNGVIGSLKTAPIITNGMTYIPLSELPFSQTLNISIDSQNNKLQIKIGNTISPVQRGIYNFNGSANTGNDINGNVFWGTNDNGFLGTLITGEMDYGTYITATGTYIGYWKNGTPHGNGRFIHSDGELYVGTFQNGARLTGTAYFTDNSQFIGTWEKASNGSVYPKKGRYISPNGTTYGTDSSEWSSGALTKSKW